MDKKKYIISKKDFVKYVNKYFDFEENNYFYEKPYDFSDMLRYEHLNKYIEIRFNTNIYREYLTEVVLKTTNDYNNGWIKVSLSYKKNGGYIIQIHNLGENHIRRIVDNEFLKYLDKWVLDHFTEMIRQKTIDELI
jgi:hypothetical protein